jgi:putative Holliday junction resolvase
MRSPRYLPQKTSGKSPLGRKLKMRILGIDYGLKKIGLAISREGEIAEPYGMIKDKEDADKIKTIIRICRDQHIEKILIGLPDGTLRESVINFARRLKKEVKKEVGLVDETLTTKKAISIMKELKFSRNKKGIKEDQIAAALMLQEALDQETNDAR